MTDPIATRIRTDVDRLCRSGDRDLGTERNRAATDYVAERLREAGLDTDTLDFDVPEWRAGDARVAADGLEIALHPGPFSPALDAEGPLVLIDTADEIATIDSTGAVLLLKGEIAHIQLTPRGYPFYSEPEHAGILDALEAARPLAVLAATGKSVMTAAMSPFPLIEEVGFAAPTAYMTEEKGAQLAERAGETVAVTIESEVRPSTGAQPVGRRQGADGRVVVCAHVDSKPDTPGAVDNAAGVAVLLAVADLLRDADAGRAPRRAVEFVPFNGEDHVLAPGELAWLAVNEDLSDVALAINIDGAGLAGAPSACSLYDVGDAVSSAAVRLAEREPSVAEGPQWPASDHMIFAMQGVPAIAVTSTDFAAASGEYAHTAADVPEILDYDLLAGTARFVAALVAEV